MKPGLYERVIDKHLESLLEAIDKDRLQRKPLDEGNSHNILAKNLMSVLAQAFERIKGDDKVALQIDLYNRLVDLLKNQGKDLVSDDPHIIEHLKPYLFAVKPEPVAGEVVDITRPGTPLSSSCLLTGTRADPSLMSQLRAELRTANQVDILCSFIKWSGIRILEEELKTFTGKSGSRLRIITTSYMGATDVKAVEFLRNLPRTELKVSYDTKRTRLHAKAYAFYRETGFGTAYVGSANISHAALTEGLEWNVKISEYEAKHLWDKVTGTFHSYWADSEFTPYVDGDQDRLQKALEREVTGSLSSPFFYFEITPYPYQQEILDKIDVERTYQNRWRNLIVAATGTGKTVIAALDYRRFQQDQLRQGKTARLLFIAHRKEILEQSQACFQAVLRNANFGELLVGNYEARNREYLFASIQSYNSKELWRNTAPDLYDYIVIDETHRIGSANLYKDLLAHIQPKALLGLTATPERTDGQSILDIFDGHITAEIRLPTAINRKLLSPFQYFGISDEVDLSHITWRRGGYAVDELNRQYTGNDSRADLVLRKVDEILLDVKQACGLGFCVSVAHAQFMAAYFQKAGVPAIALSSETSEDERNDAKRKLVAREVNFIFVVDLYNEGVDIPEVDTVLFLRPTESLTVFLQQLGRGLRICDGKDCLTVLDFIGKSNRNYNFEIRYRALMDHPKRRLDSEIKDGDMPLPAGCAITFEKQAQSYVLDNIARAINGQSNALAQRLQSFNNDTGHKPTFLDLLDYYEMQPDDLYRRCSWTTLCARAGLREVSTDPDSAILEAGLRKVAHISGPRQLQRLLEIIPASKDAQSWTDLDRRLLTMLHVTLWHEWKPETLEESLARLRSNPDHCEELLMLLRYRFDKLASVAPKLSLHFLCPLELHAAYSRDEILAGLGYWTLQERKSFREGVLHLKDLPADAFFVTLNKTESEYSPTTMYADYAINDRLFHWQTQSTTRDTSGTGQRYINHADRGNPLLLFVREDGTHDNFRQPFYFLGPVNYRSHTGNRPMSIQLELQYPIPAWLQPTTRRLAIS